MDVQQRQCQGTQPPASAAPILNAHEVARRAPRLAAMVCALLLTGCEDYRTTLDFGWQSIAHDACMAAHGDAFTCGPFSDCYGSLGRADAEYCWQVARCVDGGWLWEACMNYSSAELMSRAAESSLPEATPAWCTAL